MSAESQGFDPYEAVIADLRAKRDQIDQAISLIEALRGIGTVSPFTMGPVAPSQNVATEGPGAFLGMTIPEAAKKLLASRRQTLGNADIVAAFKAGGLAMNSADPINTVGSVLTRRANSVGDIVRVSRGIWGLAEWYPNRSFKKKPPIPLAIPGQSDSGPNDDEPQTVASVPFMIAQAQREQLRAAGLGEEDIRNMKPEDVQGYIDLMS